MQNMNILSKHQQGFTLIELVIVIVILGVLAAVALPKFVDLKTDARNAAMRGVTAAISSGSATNYAAKLVGKPSAVTLNQPNICTTAILGSVMTGGLPAGFSVETSVAATCASTEESGICLITDGQTPTILQSVTVFCAR